jgi:hypothetical protein
MQHQSNMNQSIFILRFVPNFSILYSYSSYLCVWINSVRFILNKMSWIAYIPMGEKWLYMKLLHKLLNWRSLLLFVLCSKLTHLCVSHSPPLLRARDTQNHFYLICLRGDNIESDKSLHDAKGLSLKLTDINAMAHLCGFIERITTSFKFKKLIFRKINIRMQIFNKLN